MIEITALEKRNNRYCNRYINLLKLRMNCVKQFIVVGIWWNCKQKSDVRSRGAQKGSKPISLMLKQ